MADWRAYIEANRDRYRREFLEFLHIPSISALPEHADDVQRAAEWTAARMRAAGLEGVEILPTGGHPVVYGEWLHAPGRPTVLLYGHFDVQPVDPLPLWHTPPFAPSERDGRIYARGASDMKNSLLMSLVAIEAWLKTTGALPVNLKCLFEGQEEIGSPQLPAFLDAECQRFACDVVLNCDGGQWDEQQGQLNLATKGICGIQIDVRGANTDLHSGTYGGAVANPLHALAHLIASMRSIDGKILVEGFYDDVVPLSEQDRAMIAAVPFDEQELRQRLEVSTLVSEPGYTPLEQMWARPTLEVNGLWGGFQGEGTKTVLPNEAHAKITCRLVANQDPEQTIERLRAHVQRQTLPGVTVEVNPLSIGAYPYLSPPDHWGNRAAAAVLREVYGREPYYTRTGGSVPVLALLQRTLGAHSVTVGLSLRDEQIHAPNEFTRISTLERGPLLYARLLERLAAGAAPD